MYTYSRCELSLTFRSSPEPHSLGIRVRLERAEETKSAHDGTDYHTVHFSYLKGRPLGKLGSTRVDQGALDDFNISHGMANDTEKQRYLNIAENDDHAVKLCEENRVYLIKLMPVLFRRGCRSHRL